MLCNIYILLFSFCDTGEKRNGKKIENCFISICFHTQRTIINKTKKQIIALWRWRSLIAFIICNRKKTKESECFLFPAAAVFLFQKRKIFSTNEVEQKKKQHQQTKAAAAATTPTIPTINDVRRSKRPQAKNLKSYHQNHLRLISICITVYCHKAVCMQKKTKVSGTHTHECFNHIHMCILN